MRIWLPDVSTAGDFCRRFIDTIIILIPAMVSRRARSITIRLISYQPSLDQMFSAWRTIERTGFGQPVARHPQSQPRTP